MIDYNIKPAVLKTVELQMNAEVLYCLSRWR